uniref:Peptidase A2 domain-containing protein n=1 Tax=Glossina austeni TaxID=7395 RepID=A0A1A9V2P3_GLOAU
MEVEANGTNLCFEANSISINIGGRRVTGTVDTGAAVSILAETFTRALEQRFKSTTHRTNIFLADETQLETGSILPCPLQFWNRTALVPFAIMLEATGAMLLGYNFLKAFGVTLTSAKKLHLLMLACMETSGSTAETIRTHERLDEREISAKTSRMPSARSYATVIVI